MGFQFLFIFFFFCIIFHFRDKHLDGENANTKCMRIVIGGELLDTCEYVLAFVNGMKTFFFISMIGLSVCKVNPAQANKLSPYSRNVASMIARATNYHPEEKQPEIEKTIFNVTLADAKHPIFVVLY